MLPIQIDRHLARQPDDGARAIYLHHQMTAAQFQHAIAIEALQYRLRFIASRAREAIAKATGESR